MDSSSWGVPAEYTPQAVASFKIDEKAHSELVNEFDEAASPREARRLLRCAQSPCERVCDRSALQGRRRRGHYESSPLPHCGAVPSRHPVSSPMKSLALCARSPSTLWRPRHLLAQRQEIASPTTTLSATWLRTSPIKACFLASAREARHLGLCPWPPPWRRDDPELVWRRLAIGEWQ